MATFDPYPITIDILSRKEPPLVYFHEDDFNTAKLVLHLKRGKTAIALTQSKVRIVLKKEDETIGYLDCDVTDPANGIVEVILSSNSLSVSGVVVCELYISMADKTFVTPRFKYLVDEALFPSGMIESSNEYQSLLNIMKDVEEAQGSFNEAVANLDNKTKEVVTDANKKVSETLSTLNTNGQAEIDKITQTASETKNEADAIINKAKQDTTAAVTKIEKDGAEVIAGFYQSADVEMRKIRTTAEAAKVKSEENTTQIGILSQNVTDIMNHPTIVVQNQDPTAPKLGEIWISKGVNIIANGDFETATGSEWALTHGAANTGSHVFAHERVTTQKAKGLYSLHISSNDPDYATSSANWNFSKAKQTINKNLDRLLNFSCRVLVPSAEKYPAGTNPVRINLIVTAFGASGTLTARKYQLYKAGVTSSDDIDLTSAVLTDNWSKVNINIIRDVIEKGVAWTDVKSVDLAFEAANNIGFYLDDISTF